MQTRGFLPGMIAGRLNASGYRSIQMLGLMLSYAGAIVASFHIAYELRWDFSVPNNWQAARLQQMLWVLPLKLALLWGFGQVRTLVHYFGLPDLIRIALALSAVAWLMLAGWYVFNTHGIHLCPPRAVVLTDFMLSFTAIASIRFGLRVYRERYNSAPKDGVQHRVAIVGAGDLGAALAHDAIKRPSIGIRPVIFLDDNVKKIGASIHGIPVFGTTADIEHAVARFRLAKLVVTMPSASEQKLREIIEAGQKSGVSVEIVPSWRQLATGEVRIDRIRPVELEDLLGRKSVPLDTDAIGQLIRGRCVLVTGAGGSIGGELCRQILGRGPSRLVLLDQSEPALFTIEQELLERGGHGTIVTALADVLDAERMRDLLDRHRPQVLFHAAAHKHVPMLERHPTEALKNNTFATSLLCLLAQQAGVERFVLISTDKAINPTSIMGASKRLAELAMQARQDTPGNRTRFMAVRFGNVLGSSGSVVPIFRRQIAMGGPVTVTHPDVSRYFMTIGEAVGLVLQAATQGRGGEIFVLEMGQPIKILDVARQLIELSGFRPGVDIEVRFTGLRPGEKLTEEIQHSLEGCEPTTHPHVKRLTAEAPNQVKVDAIFSDLEQAIEVCDVDELKSRVQRHLPEYKPALLD